MGTDTPHREPRKSSFWTWLTVVYFIGGVTGIALMAIKDSPLAAEVGVYWAAIFIGLGLVSLGMRNLEATWGRVVRSIGWIWLALILAMLSLTNNPAITG